LGLMVRDRQYPEADIEVGRHRAVLPSVGGREAEVAVPPLGKKVGMGALVLGEPYLEGPGPAADLRHHGHFR